MEPYRVYRETHRPVEVPVDHVIRVFLCACKHGYHELRLHGFGGVSLCLCRCVCFPSETSPFIVQLMDLSYKKGDVWLRLYSHFAYYFFPVVIPDHLYSFLVLV